MIKNSKPITGWKTIAAGTLSITYGVLGVLFGMHDFGTGTQFCVNGLAIIGIGHKIEKSKV